MTSNNIIDQKDTTKKQENCTNVLGVLKLDICTKKEDIGDILNKEYIAIPLTNKQEVELEIESYSIVWIDNDDDEFDKSSYGEIELDVSMTIECSPDEKADAANYMLSELNEDMRWVCGVSFDGRFVRYDVQGFNIEWYEEC